jgi:putative endonuclease
MSKVSTNDAGNGGRGELLAERYLARERGFRIEERNWRNPADRREEVDLIAWDGACLVFIEVKTRREGARVPGFYAVDSRKKRALQRACRAYLAIRRPRTYRLDIVEVSCGAGAPALRHFENVGMFPSGFAFPGLGISLG